MTYHYVLGAPDPEMARIEEILKKDLYSYATLDGRRVAPSTAYKANKIDPVATTDSIVTIECSVSDDLFAKFDLFCAGKDLIRINWVYQ